MDANSLTCRIRPDTHRQLKLLAFLRNASMIDVLAQIVADELDSDLWEAGENGKATIRAALDSPVTRTLTPSSST